MPICVHQVVNPTHCESVLNSGELCIAQGMGWFDDQLNFDISVSLYFIFLWSNLKFDVDVDIVV